VAEPQDKRYHSASAFIPENLLREALRQKSLREGSVPDVCVLDPDGDLVRKLIGSRRATLDEAWACDHTELYRTRNDRLELGLVGCAVGASFADLIAEELFASGCRLLISVTSAGQLVAVRAPPYFILIDRALCDEGTSYHYLPPAEFSAADDAVLGKVEASLTRSTVTLVRGPVWTTDAPFRQTPAAIDAMKARGLLAVEMEAAALHAFATATSKPVLCFAHVTHQMAQVHGDFDKGVAHGTVDALALIGAAARAWRDQVV